MRDPGSLRLYAVLRGDVIMSEGKANAQAGHAYVDTLLLNLMSSVGQAYCGLKPGTKICLDGGSFSSLLRLMARLDDANIPYVRIVDRDHVELPDFDGSDVLTAIGIGPLHRDDTPTFLKRLALWKGGKRLRDRLPAFEEQAD